MKKVLLNVIISIMLISMLFALTGCKNNNEIEENEQIENQINEEKNTEENINSEIIGKWTATRTNNSVYSLGELYGSAFSFSNELTFKEDGTYVLGIGVTYWQEGNYEINGDKIKLTNTQIKGDNPDGKTTEQFIIKNEDGKNQIILEESQAYNVTVGIIFEKVEDNLNTTTDGNVNKNEVKRLRAGDFYLEYGSYTNVTYESNSPQYGTYKINEDGTFSCTTSEGTATGTYTVQEETYDNSNTTSTDWLITFKSSNTNIMNANASWIIDGNNKFSGIQSGGTFKYMGN